MATTGMTTVTIDRPLLSEADCACEDESGSETLPSGDSTGAVVVCLLTVGFDSTVTPSSEEADSADEKCSSTESCTAELAVSEMEVITIFILTLAADTVTSTADLRKEKKP